MMSLVVDRCAEILAAAPDPVLPAPSVGSRRPATEADVPAATISLAVDTPGGIGLGRYIREGDVLGDRYRGTLTLDLWANSASELDGVARKLQARLTAPSALLREKGFGLLRPADLGPAENTLYQPPTGTAFPVWTQRLSYRFVFEYEEAPVPGDGGTIQRIDVNVAQPPESFVVP